ncbi:MAG: SPFH domain-containing protein [Candidatus Hodarchaeales archaeon]|jgi:regulator of protease activity HflC (stomatin/prohibitin superfamily)
MFQWLGNLLEWFASWIPRVIIVNKTHAGVKFRWGKVVIPLDAGVHIYWPIVTDIMQYPVVRHTHDLECQALMTKDGYDIRIKVAVVCEIHNIVAALADNYDVNDTVGDVTRGTIAECIFIHDLEELRVNFLKIRESLEKIIGKVLNDYGITVLEVKITELSKCRTLKHAGVVFQADNV